MPEIHKYFVLTDQDLQLIRNILTTAKIHGWKVSREAKILLDRMRIRSDIPVVIEETE